MFSIEFDKIVQFRRSNRSFDPNIKVPDEIIQKALEHAILSPNSSNMQLWEFHWISSKDKIEEFIPLCLSQSAAKTAQQMIVFVTRQDKWKSRAQWNEDKVRNTIIGEPNAMQKGGIDYYKKVMPLLYMQDIFGIMGLIRRAISLFLGFNKPFFRAGGKAFQRITVHKSCALAAQTFMLSIASQGFHTCPMEGFDAIRVVKALKLPKGAEISMIIAIGKGTEPGIWGPRYRLPYQEVVVKH